MDHHVPGLLRFQQHLQPIGREVRIAISQQATGIHRAGGQPAGLPVPAEDAALAVHRQQAVLEAIHHPEEAAEAEAALPLRLQLAAPMPQRHSQAPHHQAEQPQHPKQPPAHVRICLDPAGVRDPLKRPQEPRRSHDQDGRGRMTEMQPRASPFQDDAPIRHNE